MICLFVGKGKEIKKRKFCGFEKGVCLASGGGRKVECESASPSEK